MAWSKITAARLFILAVCFLSTFSDAAVKKTRKRVVCYYTNWSVYRQGLAKYLPNNINPHLCTHLIYAFGGFNDDFELQPFDKYQDIEKGGYARFNGLKQYNKGLRTLLALGGWNEGSGRFSELVADAEYRKRFAYSAIRYLRQYNFDGLDLDWEYPGSRAGSDPSDRENYATLCEELRAAFEAESIKTNRPVLLLTVAVPAGISTIENGFDVPRLNAVVDFFNILAYDYHASSEPLTDHHAPLKALPGASEYDYRTELNVDYTVRFYLKSGAERRKLVVGIPTYGRSYTLIDGQFNGLQAAAESPGLKGKYTKEDGYLSFYEVCEMVAVDEWQVYRPYPELMGPYATKERQWVGYDDEFAAAKKAEYVRDNRLGGIMFWSVDNDDFRGRCSGQPYPLIEAAKKAYLAPIPGSPPKQQKGPTPAPPPTPDPGADFECKREGFYPHPNECNKYFWCLGGGALGLVPHRFTCPTGLLFNRNTDACDFPRSVKCKVAEKKVESITFPPTPEPIITRTPAVIGSTENPFDDYYEEYDTDNLPKLDLDFPDLSVDLFTPAKTAPTIDVLGGSRGGASAVQTSSFSLSSPEEDSEESDPADLKQLLSLIQNLGGVEGVQRLLQGESSSSFISEKERKALTKIVDKQQGLQRTRPEAVNSNSLRSRTRGSSQSSTSSNTRSQPRPSSSSSNRSRQPQEGTFGDSLLTESVANTRTNTRRRPATSGSESRRQTAAVNRRRPQYTSIQRDRSPQREQPVVVEESKNLKELQLTDVQTSRPTIVNNFRTAQDQSQRQQTIGSSDSRRQYLTLERGSGESGSRESTGDSLAEFGSVNDEALIAAFQVVARRSDGPVDPALALLPALTGLTTFTASEPDRSGALYSPNTSSLNQKTPVVRVQRRRRPESAAIDIDDLLIEEEAFNLPRQARQSRKRASSNERGRFGQEDFKSDATKSVDKPAVQQQQTRPISRTRGRGSTRFTLRRGSRRRTPTVQTIETDQQTAATEVDVTEPLPTEAVVEDAVTEPAEIAVAESTTEKSSETSRSRGTGRSFRLGGRRPVGRARSRPTAEAPAEDVQQDEPEPLEVESIQNRQPKIQQQVERLRQRVSRPRLRQRSRAPFRPRDEDDSSSITPQLTARRVPQRKSNVLSSIVEANEATTTEEPVVSGIPLRIRTPFTSRERPDPLTRARSKLRVTPTSEIVATDVPSTTELIVPSTVSEENKTKEDELSEIEDYTEEVSYPSSTTEESRPPPKPFSRPLSGSSRVRPFPFRPRGNRRPASATTRPANPFISEPEVEDIPSTKSSPESSVSLPSTTERAPFSLTDLFPGVRTTSSSVNDDSEKLTESTTDANDSEEDTFRFSTLPSRRSSTIRPPYRTRPTSSVSLYDLVQNRDDDEKRLKVQSLVEQLKSSLSGQRHLVTTALPVLDDDLEEDDNDSDDIGTTSSSASVSVSTTERHSTVSILDDDELTEIVVLPTTAGTTFRLTSPTKSIETTTELQPVFYLGTDAEVFSATTEQPEGTVLPFLQHNDSDDQDFDDQSDLDVTDLETDGWVVTPRAILKTSDREGRVLVVGPSDPRTSTTSAKPKFFTESNGAFIVTAATVPPAPVDSFVSVKVSVSSSDSESSQSTSVSDEPSTTSESAVDALFKMLSQKEREEASRPLDEEDHDQAEQAEQLNGPVLQASLFNRPPAVSQYEVQNPNRIGKPTLYDQEGILAFSTVTPRYDDPDSLFKRKTYISGAGFFSPANLIIAALSAVVLLQHIH